MLKTIKLYLSPLIFCVIAVFSFLIVQNSFQNQRYKRDIAELQNFKYGIFSVEEWKGQLTVIMNDEIDRLTITQQNQKMLKKQLEGQLVVLIEKIYKRIEKKNTDSAGGFIKQNLIESFVDIKDIKRGVPEYADAIMKELGKGKNVAQIKGIVKEKFNQYMEETFDVLPPTPKLRIMKSYGYHEEEALKKELERRIHEKHNTIFTQVAILIGLAVLVFVLEGLNREHLPASQYITLTLTLVALMVPGVLTPMIDIEAKIGELKFVLFDHTVFFKDQVLYFQSKSIMDVFQIMITHKEFQMKMVGVLVVMFSVIFPITKWITSLLYYFRPETRDNKIIRWFVAKSGKWSMADVLVVAIFMAFIGFNGIINSRLDALKEASEGLDVLTTNGTNLQPGFYLFFAYAILAMFLSGFLRRNHELIANGRD